VPWGLRKILNWIKNEYKNVPVIITENGFSDNGNVKDTERIKYLVVSETARYIQVAVLQPSHDLMVSRTEAQLRTTRNSTRRQ
jgi:short-subunit dehydrogenase involved in D-alanine esterification of teichoic acids